MKSLLANLLFAGFVAARLAAPAHAAPSTSKGNISIAQALDMIERAPTDPIARQTSMAYLFGVGETVGFLFDNGYAATSAGCRSSFSLDTTIVGRALRAAAPDPATWSQTLATPIIVQDLLQRAGCL